jgi:hypothetical protein
MSRTKITSKPGPFTSIPLLYDDVKLTVYENRLLTHYARLGSSYEGVRTTAKRCHMSQTSVINARNGLEKKGWVTVGENDKGTMQVELVNVWALDAAIYGGRIKRPHEWVSKFESAPELEQALLQMSSAGAPNIERERSISGTKEDPIGRSLEEEERARPTGSTFNKIRKEAEDIFAKKAKRKPLPVKHPQGPVWWWQPIMRMLDRVEWSIDQYTVVLNDALAKLSNGVTIKGPISVEGTFYAVIDEMEDGGFTPQERFQQWMDSQ